MQNKKFNPKRFIGMAIAAMLTIPTFSGGAQASGASLVDILQAKGVLTEGEANAAKAEAKAHHPHIKFGGRIMADYAFYADDPGLDLGDGQEFRRARLFAKGSFGDWHFKGQYDFASNKTKVKDAYIKYEGFKNITIAGGQFHEQFGLEELTSSKYITFMERSLANVFVPSRHIGLDVNGYGDFWSAAVGVFGGTANGSKKGIDSNFDLTGRVTVAPFHEKGRVLHFGGAISYRLPDSNRKLQFRERPESHVTHFRLVDTVQSKMWITSSNMAWKPPLFMARFPCMANICAPMSISRTVLPTSPALTATMCTPVGLLPANRVRTVSRRAHSVAFIRTTTSARMAGALWKWLHDSASWIWKIPGLPAVRSRTSPLV